MLNDLVLRLEGHLEALLASDWAHQLSLVFAGALLAWPLAWAVRRRFPERREGATREENLLRGLLAVAIWPTFALALSALTIEIFRRVAPEFIGEGTRALAVLGFVLLFRLLEKVVFETLPPGPRRRRIRKILLPFVFSLLVLHQVRLLAPLIEVLRRPLISFDDSAISVMSILVAVLVVFSAAIVGRFLQSLVGTRLLTSFGMEMALAEAMATVARYVLVVIGFIWALDLLGFDLTTVKVILGALGVGIGFGLQNIVNNFTSGLILLFERSVKRGDVLTVQGTDARVKHVGLRASVIRNRQGDDLIMPNSMLVENIVTNYSFHDRLKRVDVAVGVSYNADPRTVERILLDAATKCKSTLPRPEPTVLFMGFGESSIDFSLRVWVDDAWEAPVIKSQVLFDVWYALKAEGIEIPFPQRDLHLRSGELPIRRAEDV